MNDRPYEHHMTNETYQRRRKYTPRIHRSGDTNKETP